MSDTPKVNDTESLYRLAEEQFRAKVNAPRRPAPDVPPAETPIEQRVTVDDFLKALATLDAQFAAAFESEFSGKPRRPIAPRR